MIPHVDYQTYSDRLDIKGMHGWQFPSESNGQRPEGTDSYVRRQTLTAWGCSTTSITPIHKIQKKQLSGNIFTHFAQYKGAIRPIFSNLKLHFVLLSPEPRLSPRTAYYFSKLAISLPPKSKSTGLTHTQLTIPRWRLWRKRHRIRKRYDCRLQ